MFIYLDDDKYPIQEYEESDGKLFASYSGIIEGGIDYNKLFATKEIERSAIEEDGVIRELPYTNCYAAGSAFPFTNKYHYTIELSVINRA